MNRILRKLFILLLAACLLCLAACGGDEANVPAEKGETLFGSFAATDLEGNAVNEEIFAGHKLTMINIWATFCGPCISEMPDLAKLSTAYGDDFQIVGIPVDITDRNGAVIPDQKKLALEIIAYTGANYRHLIPSESLNKAYLFGVQVVPETVFVDSEGRQVGQSYLGARSEAEWRVIIESLLETLP